MPWIAPVVGLGASLLSSGSKGGGGGGGSQPMYMPTGESQVDQSWQNMFNAGAGIATGGQSATTPYFSQSLSSGEGINYQPYLDSAGKSGSMYADIANLGREQMGGYMGQAQTAQQQQQALYGAGNQVYQTAFDPQQALYGKTQQTLQDQVRAGQAARGLGNSEAGAMEEAQAMGDFNINWQNAQLGRQVSGIQAMGTANAGGIAQGNLYGQDLTGAMGAGTGAAQAYGMSGSVPLQAQTYAAMQPGNIANTYNQWLGGQQGLYGTAMGGAQSYMGLGQTAGNTNYNATSAQNQAETAMFGQAATGLWNQFSPNWNSTGSTGNTGLAGASNSDQYLLRSMSGYGGGV